MKRKVLSVMIVVFGLSLTLACSKNLMPPEAGMLGEAATDNEMGAIGSGGGSSGAESSGSTESSPGFFREESVDESASSGNFTTSGPSGSAGRFAGSGPGDLSGSGSRSFGSGSGVPGDGSSGSFGAEPFSGGSERSGGSGGSGGGTGGFGGSGDQEARLGNFKVTSELKDIHFKFDRYDLDDESRTILRKNVDHLKANPAATIEVQGHCDERGTNNYNIALGERRAQSTKMYLVSQGVSSRRIHTISYGEERPFCFDSNDRCWSENRRAHFRISE